MEVSAVIPFFNSSPTLVRAFESVRRQKFIKEIILVDDGSTDGSCQIAKDLALSDPKTFVFSNSKPVNKGACAARNLGLNSASSDWIQFLDADDELLEGKIAVQLSVADDGMSFIVGNAIDCFEDGHSHLRKYLSDPRAGLIAGKLGITSANLWNRKSLLEVGGWSEGLSSSQEYDLMFRLLKRNDRVGFCGDFLSKIHKRPDSISQNPKRSLVRAENWLRLRHSIKEYLRGENRFSLFRNYTYSGYLLDFCSTNALMDRFDGSRFLGELFWLEKQVKTKAFGFVQSYNHY